MTGPGDAAAARRGERVRLIALLDGMRVGQVHQSASGTLRFTYDDEWRENPAAYPLSLSLPLTAREHKHEPISAFLWGLLPDNGRTLDHYARLFGVSAGNPVALLSYIGADCAGAVQFAPPARANALLGTTRRASTVEWLSEADVAEELRTVREQGIPGTSRATVGQFSLAGAQPKIALLEENGRWGRPNGRVPTNRILKPPSKDFRGFAENEHLCLSIASELGLGAVTSRVVRFNREVAIVVDRFDRVKSGGAYRRIHQEDVCQALGVPPTRKYENEGGPGIADIVSLLRDTSRNVQEDVDRFLGVVILDWVLSATDAHAKNYALLHGPGGGIRLAPFYDIASYLPYAEPDLHRVKLAMKVGGAYLVRRINRASWQSLAKATGIPAAHVLGMVDYILRRLPEAVTRARDHAVGEGLDRSIVDSLAARIHDRATACVAVMGRAASITGT